jgi:hypothetical protein
MMEIDDFISTIHEQTPTMIEEQSFRHFELRDLNVLERLFTAVDADIFNMENGIERDKRMLALGAVRQDIKRLKSEQAKAEESVNGRVAGVTVGLDEELKHRIDLNSFSSRVNGLFTWHNNEKERSEYMAPYFPVIQSSGTGKTRLFTEFRSNTSAKTDYDCKTVLCSFKDGIPDPGSDRFFDAFLFLPKSDRNPEKHGEITETIAKALYSLVRNSTKDKLVLLFDEAQCLVGLDGFGFRHVRWWLRQKREKQIVAVFAGTTSKLANFYEDVTTGTSRDTEAEYVNFSESSPNTNPSKIYDPFFRICTIGCYRNESPPLTTVVGVSDLQRAAYFGRPLFAYLAKEGTLVRNDDVSVTNYGTVISNVKLHAILSRMLTSHTDNWRGSKAALCSILGSRVQMGITTSFAMASELVSKAYAHLVDFHPDDEGKIDNAVARVSFMPDPVCAALAMGMMNKKWKLTNGDDLSIIVGETAEFWSKEAMVLLRSGLCLPEKGDSGEIMAALYMLFCGDVLRYAKDTSLRTFSVPLLDWYSTMRGDNHPSEPKAAKKDGEQGESNQDDSNPVSTGSLSMAKESVSKVGVLSKQGVPTVTPNRRKRNRKRKNDFLENPEPGTGNPVKTTQPKVQAGRQGKSNEGEHEGNESKQRANNQDEPKAAQASMSEMDVNFIQVCRNYFRGHSWKTQRGLEWMYQSSTAIYVYPNCKAIDMVVSVRVVVDGKTSYRPMLVSVKCWMHMSQTPIKKAMKKIRTLLWDIRAQQDTASTCPPALCLLVLIGAIDEQTIIPKEFNDEKLGSFPEGDTFRMISVPTMDKFGVSSALREMTRVHETAEIFSSHGFVYAEEDNAQASKVLRSGNRLESVTKFVQELFSLFSK